MTATLEKTLPSGASDVATPAMLIGGAWVQAASGKTIDVFNPATGKLIARVPAGGAQDIDAAVRAARTAFDAASWRGLGDGERTKMLWRLADLIERDMALLAELEVRDNGMPLPIAMGTIGAAAEGLRYFAGWCTKIHGVTSDLKTPMGPYHAYTRKEPVGVVGLIVPWNFPLAMACAKLAPALAAGCACILKPAEETPLSALKLGELILEAGIPAGIVNIVTGEGADAGAALAAHPQVDKISFTGSTEVGKRIVEAATGNLKKLSLELGGKSPIIICDDADLDKAIPGAAMGGFFNSGQVCVAGTRIYIQRGVYEQVLAGIAAVADSLKVGDGLDAASQLGPLVSQKQLDRVVGMIEAGRSEGARIVTGGARAGQDGYFVQPTLLADAGPDSRVMREEIFGPVLTATVFDDFDDLVEAANDSEYGLAAAVWTRDVSRAHTLAGRLAAGTVWLNCQLILDSAIPFGGYKQSGWGRENGQEGLDAYLQTKAVFTAL